MPETRKDMENKMDAFVIVCVLYNDSIRNIRSLPQFLSFAEHTGALLVISDNSKPEIQRENERLWKAEYREKIVYRNNGGNIGLSRAYNSAVKSLEQDEAWILIADDDTLFSKEYLDRVYEAAREGRTELISGIVRAGNRVLSPARNNKLFRSGEDFISEPGIYENIFCINSGLVIRKSLLDDLGGFDERLFLDMVDYCLMDRLIAAGRNRFLLVDGDIEQNFSGDDTAVEKAAAQARFAIYEKDFLNYCKITNKSALYRDLTLLKRRLRIRFMK